MTDQSDGSSDAGAGTPQGGASTQQESEQQSQTFDAGHVERIVKERLAQLKRQYGGHDPEELLAKVAELDSLKESEKSEAQRLADQLAEADRQRQVSEQRLQELLQSTAIERAAVQLGIVDPEAASQLIDRSALVIGKDGQPEPESVTAALQALTEAKPYLLAAQQQRQVPVDQGARRNALGTEPVTSATDMETLLRASRG